MADGMKFRLEGFDSLEKELRELGKDAPKVLRSGVQAGGSLIRKEARKNLGPYKRTGLLAAQLRVSTRINHARRSVTGKVRTTRDTFYGLFLEFGTIKQRPVKWLTRAVRENRTKVFDAAAARMRKRIEKIRIKNQ